VIPATPLARFEELFLEKTGNHWEDRDPARFATVRPGPAQTRTHARTHAHARTVVGRAGTRPAPPRSGPCEDTELERLKKRLRFALDWIGPGRFATARPSPARPAVPCAELFLTSAGEGVRDGVRGWG
jgi:hypothetical protein